MVTFRPFGGYVMYYVIEERCVTVFSGNPEWLCSFVFPVSSNCHMLGFFLLCSCLGFNLDFANAKLYWFFYIVRSSLVGFFGKTWIVLSFYNWIQFKVELFLQLCWPVHPCINVEYYYGPMELHYLSVYLVRSIWYLIFVNIAYTNIGIRRHAWWFDHESSSCRGLSVGFRHP